MSFTKVGSPQSLNIINKCACGNPATKNINGIMYCDDCDPIQKEPMEIENE